MEIHPSLWTMLIAKLLHKEVHDLLLVDHIIASGLVFLTLLVLSLVVRANISLVPGRLQQVIELVLTFLLDMLEENIGKDGRKYMPLIGTLAFFIFTANFLGMVPGFSAATGNFNTTVACALVVFFYYNYLGLREHGPSYVKHFTGSIAWLAPLMIIIEIIGHLARPFSLGIRLFGNIGGEHLITGVIYKFIPLLLAGMIPVVLPVPMMVLGLFAALLQTYVFIMLTQVYIAGALSHDH